MSNWYAEVCDRYRLHTDWFDSHEKLDEWLANHREEPLARRQILGYAQAWAQRMRYWCRGCDQCRRETKEAEDD